MRRAQSVRNYTTRPSIAIASDDMGMIREPGESDEDVLRKQLIEKDRLVDQMTTQMEQLQIQLTQRPPIEAHQELRMELKDLDLLLQGTQRENERAMTDLEKANSRIKLLERKLCDVVGENWQTILDIPPAPGQMGGISGPRGGILHQRASTIGTSSPMNSSFSAFRATPSSPSPSLFRGADNHSSGRLHQQHQHRRNQSTSDDEADEISRELTVSDDEEEREQREAQQQKQAEMMAAKLEQVRLMVVGMDQRLQTRQSALAKTVEKAEANTKKLEALRKELPISIAV